MARDYTKYTVEGLGENLNKRQLVFQIVKDWAVKNNPSLDEIQTAFPAETQGSKGFVVKASEVKDTKRFNMQEPLSIKNGVKVVVSNQWGTKNIDAFLSLAEKLKYNISKEEENAVEQTLASKPTDKSNRLKSYLYIKVYNENTGKDLKLSQSTVVQTNGEYILSFNLDSDGDGVIDTYYFCDFKTNVRGSNGSPWDFEEFTDNEGEWIEKYESFEDFGYDSNEIAETLESMRSEFIEKYLNEASQENWLDNAAVPFEKRDMFKEEINVKIIIDNGCLIFKEGDESILPENRKECR
tara:strand:- start:53 stop:940 length:888 start_codon:yes stop_codon:yes gene_type:complete